MRVSVFTNVKSSTPQKTDLDKIVEIMRTNQKICNMTTEYRNSIATAVRRIWKD